MNGYVALTLGASFWGFIGIFGKILLKYNLTSEQIGFFRLLFGVLGLVVFSLIKKSRFRLTKKELIYSIIMGFVCQLLYNLFYFNAIEKVGVALAAVLLYTAPIFIAVFSKIFYKEELDFKKKVSLAICFVGSIICVTGGSLNVTGISFIGLFFGIGSAVIYATMPIIGKGVFTEENNITILMYSFLFGAIFMFPFTKPASLISYMTNIQVLPVISLMGILTASLPYSLYFYGVSKNVELSKAGVLASIELIVAVIIGWSVLGESFCVTKLLGIGLMIVSGVIINLDKTSEVEYNKINEQKM